MHSTLELRKFFLLTLGRLIFCVYEGTLCNLLYSVEF